MDIQALAAMVAASVAAGAACVTVWQARGTGRDLHATSSLLRDVLDDGHRLVKLQHEAIEEQRRGTRQLETTVSTLGEVLHQATKLVELQHQGIAELRAVVAEQRQAARETRFHRQVDRLTLVGERVEELRLSVEDTKLEALHGRDTTHAIAAAIARLAHAIASTGGEVRLPQCATLARGHAVEYARNGIDILAARGEVADAIVAAGEALRRHPPG